MLHVLYSMGKHVLWCGPMDCNLVYRSAHWLQLSKKKLLENRESTVPGLTAMWVQCACMCIGPLRLPGILLFTCHTNRSGSLQVFKCGEWGHLRGGAKNGCTILWPPHFGEAVTLCVCPNLPLAAPLEASSSPPGLTAIWHLPRHPACPSKLGMMLRAPGN